LTVNVAHPNEADAEKILNNSGLDKSNFLCWIYKETYRTLWVIVVTNM